MLAVFNVMVFYSCLVVVDILDILVILDHRGHMILPIFMLKSYLGHTFSILSPHSLIACLVLFDRTRGELAQSGLVCIRRLRLKGPVSKKEVALVIFSP